jgi:hypothetical protein
MRYHRFRIERDAPTQEQYGSIVVGIPSESMTSTRAAFRRLKSALFGVGRSGPNTVGLFTLLTLQRLPRALPNDFGVAALEDHILINFWPRANGLG